MPEDMELCFAARRREYRGEIMMQHFTDRKTRLAAVLLAVLFIGALAFALTTEYVHAESESASSWQELQSKFDSLDNVTIELSQDCTASETDKCLTVPEGKTL